MNSNKTFFRMFAYDAYYTENNEFRGYEKNVVETLPACVNQLTSHYINSSPDSCHEFAPKSTLENCIFWHLLKFGAWFDTFYFVLLMLIF